MNVNAVCVNYNAFQASTAMRVTTCQCWDFIHPKIYVTSMVKAFMGLRGFSVILNIALN